MSADSNSGVLLPRIGSLLSGIREKLASLTATDAGDAEAAAIVDRSVIVRALESAGGWAARVATASAAWSIVRTAAATWARLPRVDRRRTAGAAAIVGMGIHVALVLLHGGAEGWQWTIVPALIAMGGGLLIVTREGGHPS